MLQKPEMNYVSVPELAKRWNWTEPEVCALIWHGQLVPSWHFSEYDSYPVYELTLDEETNALKGRRPRET